MLLALALICTLCGTAAADVTIYTKCGTHGTAKYMEGRTVVVSVFASDTGTSWDFKRDIERYSMCYQDLRIACEWLSEQAAAYGVNAEFVWDWLTYYDLFYVHTFSQNMVVYPSNYSSYFDCIDSEIPTDELLRKYNADNILYIFHYNTPTWNPVGSHAFPFDDLEDNTCGFELVVMYSGLFDSLASPAVYAHEMLHLFGVPDMYAENPGNQMSESFIRWYQQHYPRDIMAGAASYEYSWINFTFSELTAYYAGLCERPYEVGAWGLRLSEYERLD